MHRKRTLALLVTMGILLLGASQVTGQQNGPQSPQATYSYAFTYQGQLKDAGGPVNDTCDLRFILWNAAKGGSQVGNTLVIEGYELEDGLFTARLDFGGSVHRGDARWLEVAVRCPAGSGGYDPLIPRQELTGAPAALSLALPFQARANIGGPLVSFRNSGDGEAALFDSDQGVALWVESAGQDGVHVASTGNHGLSVNKAGSDGLFVLEAKHNGLHVNAADYNGLQVDSTSGDGVYVISANDDGLDVTSAGDDGVYVERAGNPSRIQVQSASCGFEVGGAEGDGLYVGQADANGVHVYSADDDGMYVYSASGDGVHVFSAGNPSWWSGSPSQDGFEVNGAQGYGLYVGQADLDGVYVNSTVWHGLNVVSAGVDGLYVTAAKNDGVDVTGNTYAGNFRGSINVTGYCYGCILAVFGLNASDRPLEPGQIVAIQDIQAAALDNASALWRVIPAGEGSATVGVVQGGARLDEAPEAATLREGETGQRLVPRTGAAQPGEYLSIVIYGPMQVRANGTKGPIQAGMRLAVGESGVARALKTVVVEGVSLAESAPTIGIALAAPDEDGLAWVLVNPQ